MKNNASGIPQLARVGAIALGVLMPVSAFAQSSVTLYGRVDLGVARNVGNKAYVMQYGSGGRLGLIGTEDLGGGLKAFFNIEHGFNPDTGQLSDTRNRFWNRRAFVGLDLKYAKFWLGRDYTPAYIYAQLAADPWGHNTVASMLNLGNGGITPVRVDKTANVTAVFGPVLFSGQVGQANNPVQSTRYKPTSFALRYSGKPLYVAYGYENPGNVNDIWHFGTAKYDFGPVTLIAGMGDGKTTAKAKIRVLQLSAAATIGSGELYVGYGERKNRSAHVMQIQKTAIGYHYNLSKRTKVYADVTNDRKSPTAKNGFDAGLFHMF